MCATVHYVDMADGVGLGYRRGANGGRWVIRRYVGDRKYTVETLGRADDGHEADGSRFLSFRQAQQIALTPPVPVSSPAPTMAAPEAPPEAPYTVSDAMRDYLEFKEGEGAKSVQDSRWRSDALILPVLGQTALEDLTPDQIQKWKHKLATMAPHRRSKRGQLQQTALKAPDAETVRRRRSSANRTLTVLKAALNHVWGQGRIKSDDAWRRVAPFSNVEAARERYLRVEETRALIVACEGDFRRLVQGALLTGARYGELSRFLVADFDADAGTLRVRQSKSGKSRQITLTDEAIRFLISATGKRRPTDLIFPHADASWGKSQQFRPMRAAVTAAGLGKGVSFHTLRHTWASLAVMNGVPLLVVAQNLGHADTRMVEKHYGHLTQSYKAQMIRAHGPSFGIAAE